MELLASDNQIVSFFGVAPVMAASIRVTTRCNLRCRHCYADSGPARGGVSDELTTSEVMDAVEQLAALGVNEIFFTGGEPLLRRDMADLLNFSFEAGVRVMMSTNGSAVTERFLRQVQQVDFKLFQVSIDGPRPIHDRIRGKGSFDRAVRAVELAAAYLGRNVSVGTVLSAINAEAVGEVMEIAHQAGADIFALMLLIPSGRATPAMNPSAAELHAALAEVFTAYRRLAPSLRFAHNCTIPPALYPSDLARKDLHRQCALCSFPYTIAIDARGNVAPCDGFLTETAFRAGNIREQPLASLWEQGQAFHAVRKADASRLQGVCQYCHYQEFCGGGCRAAAYIETSHLDGPDPACESLYRAGLFPRHSLDLERVGA